MAFLAALVTARADERAYCAISPATPRRAGLRARAVFFFTVFAISVLLVTLDGTLAGSESSAENPHLPFAFRRRKRSRMVLAGRLRFAEMNTNDLPAFIISNSRWSSSGVHLVPRCCTVTNAKSFYFAFSPNSHSAYAAYKVNRAQTIRAL